MRSNWFKLLGSVAGLLAGGMVYMQYPMPPAASPARQTIAETSPSFAPGRVVCAGRVEAVTGEIDVAPLVAGTLTEVRVKEGQYVAKGALIAVLDGARQAADREVAEKDVRLAGANLDRLLAGAGAEEIAAAEAAANAVRAELRAAEIGLDRARKLIGSAAMSREDLDTRTQGVERLRQELESSKKRYEALRRGPLAQEIDVARAQLEVAEARRDRARVEADLCRIYAPISGTVLKLYREAGDSVSVQYPTPIARMTDANDLRIRLDIDEANVPMLRPGLEGAIDVRGVNGVAGRIRVETIVPAFAPKRLFSPDTSERHDGRTLSVFCSVTDGRVPLYPGQRVTARLAVENRGRRLR
jgi:multidrug resistance efflux pump